MTVPGPDQCAVLEQAAQWLNRVQHGDASDHRAFRAWLQERPEHVAAADLVTRAWRQAPQAAREAGWQPRRRQAPKAALRRAFRVGAPVLGTALAGLAAVLVWAGQVQDQRIVAPRDRVASATLPDGTRVWLAPGSTISFHGNPLDRSAMLTGEATFDVAHARRRFAVTAGAVRVVDLGTLFAVSNRADRTTVTLARGAIDIQDRASGTSIAAPRPGQQVTVAGDTATIQAVDADAALAWREGRLVVQDQPLAAVATRVGELAGTAIRIDDPRLGALRVYGTYRVGEVTPFLDAVAALYPVGWRRTESGYEVYRR